MSDLVGNPEDQFSRDGAKNEPIMAALIVSNLDDSNLDGVHPSVFWNKVPKCNGMQISQLI